MINLTQEEVWAFNTMETSIQNNQAELQKGVAARDAYIKLLEDKYDAVLDRTTGRLEPKEKKTVKE